MSNKRKPISKRIRFEVFKRDSFTCQYCGQFAPNVLLHLDHITPVASGGTNDIVNLLTSCSGCNGGKGARQLDDDSIAAKQMRQLKDLNERREQIRLIAKWRSNLNNLEDEQIDVINKRIDELTGHTLTPAGRSKFKKTLKKFGLDATLSALETSASQYLHSSDKEDIEKFINYTHKIAFWNNERKTKPEIERLSLACNIAKKRWWSCNRSALWGKLNIAHYEYGVDTEELIRLAAATKGIMQFERDLAELHGVPNA